MHAVKNLNIPVKTKADLDAKFATFKKEVERDIQIWNAHPPIPKRDIFLIVLCWVIILSAIIFIATGCAHQPTRTITIPTPEVEYSHPVFKPTFEPPQIP